MYWSASPPKKLDAGLLLLGSEVIRELIEVCITLLQGGTLRRDVNVVEGIILDAEFLEKLKGSVCATRGIFDAAKE